MGYKQDLMGVGIPAQTATVLAGEVGTGIDFTNLRGVGTCKISTDGSDLVIAPGGTARWNFQPDGDLESNSSTGGNFKVTVAGKGIFIKEGSNARMGISTLTAGSVVVSTTAVAANSRIFLTNNVNGGTAGFLRVSAISAGTSFTITSSSGTDTSQIAWLIIDPA